MGMMQEFKDFAMRGHVVDMAIGIVIGAAFGRIVSSFVDDVIMPPLGMLLGGVHFADLAVTLSESGADGAPITLNYGAFVQTLVDFLIIALAIFLVVRAMNSLKRKEQAPPAEPAAPTTEAALLTEIRDLLKHR